MYLFRVFVLKKYNIAQYRKPCRPSVLYPLRRRYGMDYYIFFCTHWPHLYSLTPFLLIDPLVYSFTPVLLINTIFVLIDPIQFSLTPFSTHWPLLYSLAPFFTHWPPFVLIDPLFVLIDLPLFQSVGGLSPTSTTSSSSGLSSAGSSYPGDLLAGHSPPLSESGSTRGLTKLHFAIFNNNKKSSSGSKERKAAFRDDFMEDNVTLR